MVGIGLGIGALVVAGATQFMLPRRAEAPQPSTGQMPIFEASSTTTSDAEIAPLSATVSLTESRSIIASPMVVAGDTIVSWDFDGVYEGNQELIAKADAEIARLNNLLGKGDYADTALYVALANQYRLLGDGKREYDYLTRAISEGGGTTGLPWHNLGVLMERLGALQTAQGAYETSVRIQPEFKFYQLAYLTFLTTRMKGEAVSIEKAFADALSNLGQDAEVLALRAQWRNP